MIRDSVVVKECGEKRFTTIVHDVPIVSSPDEVGTFATSAGDLVVTAAHGYDLMTLAIADESTFSAVVAACGLCCVTAAVDSLPGLH